MGHAHLPKIVQWPVLPLLPLPHLHQLVHLWTLLSVTLMTLLWCPLLRHLPHHWCLLLLLPSLLGPPTVCRHLQLPLQTLLLPSHPRLYLLRDLSTTTSIGAWRI